VKDQENKKASNPYRKIDSKQDLRHRATPKLRGGLLIRRARVSMRRGGASPAKMFEIWCSTIIAKPSNTAVFRQTQEQILEAIRYL
jgi:hypothetical protein